MSDTWESVNVPAGGVPFYSFGSEIGQHVTGTVVAYNPTGGKGHKQEPVPMVDVQLTEPTVSIKSTGARTDYGPGETVRLTGATHSLKQALPAADLRLGDLVRIRLESTTPLPKGTAKNFEVQVKRGNGPVPPAHHPPAAQTAFGGDFTARAPF